MESQPAAQRDAVNAILGVGDESPIADVRNRKPELVREVQDYYDSIFRPSAESGAALPLPDRLIVAVRVASHTGSDAVARWYGDLALESGIRSGLIERARDVSAEWTGGNHLDAAIRHADLLATRPSEASKADILKLKQAGFTPAAIVALSQTVAFVTYQVRLIAGLRAIGNLSA